MRVAKEKCIMGSFIVAFNMYVKATINQMWQPFNLSFAFVTCCAGCVSVRPEWTICWIHKKDKKSNRMNNSSICFHLASRFEI